MLLILAACDGVILFNRPPSLGFITPQVDQPLAARRPITVTARALDDIDPVVNLTTYWTVDGEAVGGDETIDTDGTITFSLPDGLPAGNPILRLRVVDASGESSTDKRVLNIVEDAAPSFTFVRPASGGYYPADTPFQVNFIVEDDGAADLRSLTLTWEGAANTDEAPTEIDGPTERTFTVGGQPSGDNYASVVVTDALGVSASFRTDFTLLVPDVDGDGHDDPRLGGNDCDDSDPTVTEGDDYYVDADGDGFGEDDTRVAACSAPDGSVSVPGDCDDADPTANPDRDEVCDDADNDCDGGVDNSAIDTVGWYPDLDGDGYGAGVATAACEAPANASAKAGDCDDVCAKCHPGGIEACDAGNLDEDCNGVADDDDAAASGATLAYPDDDGDGRGDGDRGESACDPPADWVAAADDCDDDDGLAWSGAAEVCEDDSDNDCTGGDSLCTPIGDVDLADADAIWNGSALDLIGSSLAFLDDTDGDGIDDLAIGGWGYDASRGQVVLVTASGMGGGSLAGFTSWSGTEEDEYAGYALASAGDMDGDGLGDLWVGAMRAQDRAGAAYLVLGGSVGGNLSGAAAELAGTAAGDLMGCALAGNGDVDGDGVKDALVGAYGAGTATLVRGPTSGTMVSAAVISGISGFGTALDLIDDMDGDGTSEVLVGSPDDDSVYVFYGSWAGAVSVGDADVVWTGGAGESTGSSVARAGDSDGDGFGDVIIGAFENGTAGSLAGTAYLLSGGSAASGPLSSATAILTGASAGDYAGHDVASAGDVDGDGATDLLVGAKGQGGGGAGAGAAYLVLSPVSGTISLSAADARFLGEGAGDNAGDGLAGAGDVNGDGFYDFAIGAPHENTSGGGAGAAYLILGGGG